MSLGIYPPSLPSVSSPFTTHISGIFISHYTESLSLDNVKMAYSSLHRQCSTCSTKPSSKRTDTSYNQTSADRSSPCQETEICHARDRRLYNICQSVHGPITTPKQQQHTILYFHILVFTSDRCANHGSSIFAHFNAGICHFHNHYIVLYVTEVMPHCATSNLSVQCNRSSL